MKSIDRSKKENKMGPAEVLKVEIEREERGEIMMEFQKLAESSGGIPSKTFLLDRFRGSLEIAGSVLLGILFGTLSLFFLYTIIRIMR
jgi:hypothetical protein